MGKKHCDCKCERPYYHVHHYCIVTQVDKCHRHLIRGVTSPAPDTCDHKHEYEGVTSCNDGHIHRYRGCTERPKYLYGGHVHNMCDKTSCEDHHKHRYEGTTDRDRGTWRRCR